MNTPENNWPFQYKYIQGIDLDSIAALEYEFGIDPLDIEDISTDTQLSKIEVRQNYVYLALQFPQYDKITRKVIEKELHYIIGFNFVIAINKHYMKSNHYFELNAPEILESDLNPLEYAYEMIDAMITNTFKAIRKFKAEILFLESDIFDEETSADKILDIQNLKRNLINFSSILHPLRTTIIEFQNKQNALIQSLSKDTSHHEKLDDSLDKVKKMISSMYNFKEQVDMLSESNEALTARSTNEVIKTLTSISMLILVPNIITSFFGMNVYFGWNLDKGYGPIIIITGTMLISSFFVFWILKRMKWL